MSNSTTVERFRMRVDARALSKEIESRKRDLGASAENLEQTRQRVQTFFDRPSASRSWRGILLRRQWSRTWPSLYLRILDEREHALVPKRDVYRQLRLLRVEIQGLRASIARVRSGKAPVHDIVAFLQEAASGEGAQRDIQRRLDDLDKLKPAFFEDDIRHLRDLWKQIQSTYGAIHPDALSAPHPGKSSGNGHESWSEAVADPHADAHEASAPPIERELSALEGLDRLCREFVFWVGWRTIPDRLNGWLDASWPSSHVSFHDVFEDEMPDFEDRQRILRLLASEPARVRGGLVDPERGIIYKYSTSNVWLFVSAIGLVLAAVAATALAVLLGGRVLGDLGVLHSRWTYFFYWVALAVGALFHVTVEAAKRVRDIGTPPSSAIALSHPFQWMNAKVWPLLIRVATMLIGFFGCLMVFKDSFAKADATGDTTGIATMFLVGYALDSFVNVFAKDIEKRAGAKVAATQALQGGA